MAALPLSLANLRNERLRGDRGSHGDDRESANPWAVEIPAPFRLTGSEQPASIPSDQGHGRFPRDSCM
jgi:hypothetical protein